jgi:hypothetical protein
MMDAKHPGLAAGRWQELSLAAQLGNVGSEVSRARNWRDRNPRIAQAAFERALELMDLTLADPKHRGTRRRIRELARVREVLVDFFAGSNEYGSTGESIQRYFDAYAVASRRA